MQNRENKSAISKSSKQDNNSNVSAKKKENKTSTNQLSNNKIPSVKGNNSKSKSDRTIIKSSENIIKKNVSDKNVAVKQQVAQPTSIDKNKRSETPSKKAPTARGGRRGRSKKRKPRISPEELRRRELKKWLSVKAYILGVKITMTAPEPPYFLQVERRLIAEREQKNREQAVAQATARALREQRRARGKHGKEVRSRQAACRAQKQSKALEGERRLKERVSQLEQQREQQQQQRNLKMYQQRMHEIKLSEQRQREEKLRRQDEQRVARILKNKIKIMQ